jgi:vacuolar-type H+-ATPase subunit I/STV1
MSSSGGLMSSHFFDKGFSFLKDLQNWIFSLLTLATIAYLAYTAINTFTIFRAEERKLSVLESIEKKTAIEREQLNDTEKLVKESVSRLERISDLVDDKSQAARSIIALQARTDSINTTISSLNQKLDALNSVITSTPEKALALPLIKKDVEDLRAESGRQADEIRGEMNRMYDMNKWLMGLILAALVGTIINNVIQARKAEKAA